MESVRMVNNGECKVIFKEGKLIRVLRGIIEKEDELFVYIKRVDGDFQINKNVIIKIERVNHD